MRRSTGRVREKEDESVKWERKRDSEFPGHIVSPKRSLCLVYRTPHPPPFPHPYLSISSYLSLLPLTKENSLTNRTFRF